MAENLENLPPVLQRQKDNTGDEDNESVISNDLDNTQDFSRLESDIKEQMTNIATQVKNGISDMTTHMQQRFDDFDRQVQRLESQLQEHSRQIASQVKVSSLALSNENSNNLRQSAKTSVGDNSSSVSQNSGLTGPQNQGVPSDINLTPVNKGDNFVKLKPQNYSGTDEFEDFLAQFEITSEINGWNYKAKSLYLANSLTGTARSLLSELTDEQRRDYKCLVQKLTARFGSENRGEVFRAQLKACVKGKTESIAELAQAIKKLSRQAYPKASLDVIEALALDHFIDALSETEIRLRLREVGPKTLNEAESIAVRMEAHRIADKQRTRLVGKIEQEGSDNSSGQKIMQNQMSALNKNLDSLQKQVENLYQQRTFVPNNANRKFPNQNGRQNINQQPYNRAGAGRPNIPPGNRNQNNFQGYNSVRWNQQSRGDNPNNLPNQNQNRQGNPRQPNQGSGFRLN